MQSQPLSGASSADNNVWIWIILAALLFLGTVVGVGALMLVNANQQTQLPTGTQTTPTR